MDRRRLMITIAFGLMVTVVGLAFVRVIVDGLNPPSGEAGALTEVLYERPPDVALPVLVDVSRDWGLAQWRAEGTDPMRAGVAMGDLNGDGFLDLAVAAGRLSVFMNPGDLVSGGAFASEPSSFDGDFISVSIADLDADGRADIVAGQFSGPLHIAFGDGRTATLGPDRFSPGVIVFDADDDGRRDIVQLNYDAADLIWHQNAAGEFTSTELPDSDGKSMTAAVFDANGDGRRDIWVTRDVGWSSGQDSVYARDDEGRWRDIASTVGGGQAIDGMGITAADLSADGLIDVYLSDLGDNEVLVQSNDAGGAQTFASTAGAGIARIRPPDSPAAKISSSWSSGASDVNLDGILDLIVVNGGFVGNSVPNKIDGSLIERLDPPAVFLGRGDGTYADVWSELGVAGSWLSRGLAMGDLDGDNDVDIVISNIGTGLGPGPSMGLVVLRNDSSEASGVATVIQASGCVGSAIRVDGDEGPLVTIVGAHSFLGHHGAEISIGLAAPAAVLVDGVSAGIVEPGDVFDVSPFCATTR